MTKSEQATEQFARIEQCKALGTVVRYGWRSAVFLRVETTGRRHNHHPLFFLELVHSHKGPTGAANGLLDDGKYPANGGSTGWYRLMQISLTWLHPTGLLRIGRSGLILARASNTG
ncbi:hypothetical protein VTK26DRAFT_4670 [Humicola hyalothermophila]